MQPALQYSAPFLITLGVHVLDPNATKSVVTAHHVRATQNAKSKMADVMPDVRKKLDDWSAAANAIDTGGSLVSLYHQLAIFTAPGARPLGARGRQRHLARARLPAQRRRLHAPPGAARQPADDADAALAQATSRKMRRVTRKTMSNAIHIAPLIAEWRGTRTPALVFGGRRGQLMTLDLFDNDLGNYNCAIIGAPGSGKSVLMNELAWSYRAIGAKVWMLDLGRSFEKLCRKAQGTYVEFRPDVDICLNPFTYIVRHQRGHRHARAGHRQDVLDAAHAGGGPVQGHLRDGAPALASARPRPHDHRAARRLQDWDASKSWAGSTMTSASRTSPSCCNPYAKGWPVRALLRGRNPTSTSATTSSSSRTRSSSAAPTSTPSSTSSSCTSITGEMYLTRNRRKVLFDRRVEAAAW
jgi:conjugal transfer ATP-binding protein TraC